jgi:hypothetical protein
VRDHSLALLTATTTDVPADTSPSPSGDPAPPEAEDDSITGRVVQFTAGTTTIDVTITEDTPATRDFLSMLPLTLSFEEFNGREKIAYLPRALDIGTTPGSDPEDGDLIYYVPWGNLGFYYNTAGVGFSDDVLRIGTFNASIGQLERLEGERATVDMVSSPVPEG